MKSGDFAIYDSHMFRPVLTHSGESSALLLSDPEIHHQDHCHSSFLYSQGRQCDRKILYEELWGSVHTLSWQSGSIALRSFTYSLWSEFQYNDAYKRTDLISMKNVCMGHHELLAIWVTSAGVKEVLVAVWQDFAFLKFRWNHCARGGPAKSRYSGHVNSRLMRDRSK